MQKLVHVRTLDKMTTAACQVFFQEVDSIRLQDPKKLKTLNFDRYLPLHCALCVFATASISYLAVAHLATSGLICGPAVDVLQFAVVCKQLG